MAVALSSKWATGNTKMIQDHEQENHVSDWGRGQGKRAQKL
jgi:hypothetical protein